ncbi:MAG: choice-of-anchor Q domain-containing protein [Planctomycetota bacterium]|jgi:hypothetical protein
MKGLVFVLATLLIAGPAEGLHLKVDLALPQWGTDVPWPGTAKEGWWPFVAARWADMYAHDCVWEHDSQVEGGIDNSGVHAMLSCGYEGQGGLHAKDLCRCSLAGDCPPSGNIVGEPIANTWYRCVDWPGPEVGDIVLILADLPAGVYELTSYHNHWEPGPDDPRCCRCVSPMPPMPSVTANPLPTVEQGCKPPDKPGYEELCHCGTGGGVTAIENAYDVPVTYAYSDGEVSKSVIRFQTDGSEVLVIYEAPDWGFPDCARPGREGGRAILNAFELVPVGLPLVYVDDDAPGDPGPGDASVSDPMESGSQAHPFDTIQEAIDAANESDEVIVSAGTYSESIDFGGKNIIVRSIDPTDWQVVADTTIKSPGIPTVYGQSAVTFSGSESSACVLSGFTITNGAGNNGKGGGVCGNGTLATIEHNIISGNYATCSYFPGCQAYGGGLYDCDGLIQYNIISENVAYAKDAENSACGGGLYGCDGKIRSNLIARNSVSDVSGSRGGGLARCNGTIENNTVFGNLADYGGGLYECDGTIRNCIIGCNVSDNLFGCGANVTYNNIPGGYPGAGNIDADPLLVAPGSNDYHLLAGSPCINAGDPNYTGQPEETDLDGNRRIAAARIDMGAYEFQGAVYVDDDAPGDPEPGDPNISDPLENGSQAHPFDAIQEAIDAAESSDTVMALDGTYTGAGNKNLDFHGKAIKVRSSDPEDPCVVAATVIDCQNSGRGFYFHSGEDANSVVCGFTLRNGSVNGLGGGIYCIGSSPTIKNCVITYNHSYEGGGINCESNSNPAITDCTISNNVAQAPVPIDFGCGNPGYGGGIYCSSDCHPVIDNCRITDNRASGSAGWGMPGPPCDGESYGGGIYGDAAITNSLVTGNIAGGETGGEYVIGGAAYGGGIYGNATISNCVVSYNIARGGRGPDDRGYRSDARGGGVCGNITISNSTVSYNLAESGFVCDDYKDCLPGAIAYGGGIFGNVTVNNCRILGNAATGGGSDWFELEGAYGGGIYGGGTINNSIVIDNNAVARDGGRIGSEGSGGGICCDSAMSINNCTIAGNTAVEGISYRGLPGISRGGGVKGNAEISNCILWSNTAVEGPQIYGNSTVSYSDIQGGYPGAGNIDANPLFAGGDDCHLLAGSPCINAGDPNYTGQPGETDLDGNQRIVAGRVDMGAYEFQGVVYVDDDAPGDPGPGDANVSDPMENGSQAHPFDEVQEGIDVASDSGWVAVYPGIYEERIDFVGKAITVAGMGGAAIIQAPGNYAVWFSHGEDTNSVFKNFVVRNSYGGLLFVSSSPTVSQVTVVDCNNGAIAEEGAQPDISNSIFWNNADGDLYQCEARYSCIERGGEGLGNINSEPLFVKPANGDYHLKSEGWRWAGGEVGWTWDEVTSRCIDAGNPGAPLGNEPESVPRDPNNDYAINLRINMGAYGGTSQASMGPHGWALPADLNNDGIVNWPDFGGQAEGWQKTADEQPGDANRDGVVNMTDLALLAEGWLDTTTWAQ